MTAEMIAYGIDYIYYIVAHLLKVIYDVHIVDTRLIFVYAVVDVLHIVGAQLIAQIVDFTLFVVRSYYVDLAHLLDIAEEYEHVGHSLFYITEHGVDIAVNQLVKLHTALLLAKQYLCRRLWEAANNEKSEPETQPE